MISVVRLARSRPSAAWSSRSFSVSRFRDRLVHHQDRRVAQKRAGDRQPLALPAGELRAALAGVGVVALRQRGDEVVRQRQLGRPLDLGVAGVGLAQPGCCRGC